MSDDDNWVYINVSSDAHQAIKAMAQGGYRETGEPLMDGAWRIPIQQSTLDALMAAKRDDEDVSECIVRLMSEELITRSLIGKE